MMNQDQKIPLVLYSGGLDSTFLMHLLLQKQDVDMLYVHCNGTEERRLKEMGAMERAVAYFRDAHAQDLYQGLPRALFEVTLDQTLIHTPDRRLIQPAAWIIGAICRFDPARHSELIAGYVLGDTAPVLKTEMEAVWRNLYAIMHFCDPKEAPSIRYPLVEDGYDKCRILEDLPVDLADKLWYCELPARLKDSERIVFCGTCPSCVRHRFAIREYEEKHKISYYQAWLHGRESQRHAAVSKDQSCVKESLSLTKELTNGLVQDSEITD